MTRTTNLLIAAATIAVLAIILAGCGTQPPCPAPGLCRDMGGKDAAQVCR